MVRSMSTIRSTATDRCQSFTVCGGRGEGGRGGRGGEGRGEGREGEGEGGGEKGCKWLVGSSYNYTQRNEC